MATVSVDTSALMLPVELDIRIFEELERLLGDNEAVVPEAVLAELERLGEERGKVATAATVGRSLAAEHCRMIRTNSTTADDAVLELALDGTATHVVTADRELATRVLDAGYPAITPRGRHSLAIQHP